ncbi:uncharacterized [Tachysurus ichikawai]
MKLLLKLLIVFCSLWSWRTNYKRKAERTRQDKDSRGVWNSLRLISSGVGTSVDVQEEVITLERGWSILSQGDEQEASAEHVHDYSPLSPKSPHLPSHPAVSITAELIHHPGRRQIKCQEVQRNQG